MQTMQPGDHLVIPGAFGVASLYHHGIYAGDNQVVHYWNDKGVDREKVKDPASGVIQTTPLADFEDLATRRNQRVAVLPHPSSLRLAAGDTVQRAKLMLGTRAYDLFRNNCEHFANWAVFGIPYSAQVDYLVGDTTPNAPMKFGYNKRTKQYEFYYTK